MSARAVAADDLQPETFEFSEQMMVRAKMHIGKYPAGRQQSAVIPLLDMAQRQHGGWLPRAAIAYVADLLDMPEVRAFEVATFYSMFNLAPVGRHFVQVCRTTPCWLRGSDDITNACRHHLGVELGETTGDGQFTIVEVECLGACVNAPMVQVNDDFFEDLDAVKMTDLLDALATGREVRAGPQDPHRQTSAPATGPTTLVATGET